MSKEYNQNEKKSRVGIGSLLIKQIICAAVCFAVVYGMYASDNQSLNNYASSFGRALRYDADIEQAARSAAEWVKEQLGVISDDNSELPDGVSFQ